MDIESDLSNSTNLDSNKSYEGNESTIEQEELIDDLRDSLSSTVDTTSRLLQDLISNIEISIKDEDIKIDAKKIVSDVNNEFIRTLDNARNIIEDNFDQVHTKIANTQHEEE